MFKLLEGKCINYIISAKNDFGLDSFKLMSAFGHAAMRAKIQPALATLHQQVLANGAFWNRDPKQNQLLFAVSRRRPVQIKIG